MASLESPLWHNLIDELNRVRSRWTALRRAGAVALFCLGLAITALVLRQAGFGGWIPEAWLPEWSQLPGAILLGTTLVFVTTFILGTVLVPRPEFDKVVRGLEHHFPDLDSRLHAIWSASEPDTEAARFFRRQLLLETLAHARSYWAHWKPAKQVWLAQLGTMVSEVAAGVTLALLLLPQPMAQLTASLESPSAQRYPASLWQVEPGNTSVEVGSSLRFTVELPGLTLEPLWLVVQSGTEEQRYELEGTLSDPIYTTSLARIDQSFSYWIESSSDRTPSFEVTVYERPRLLSFEVRVTPPAYTGLPEEVIQEPQHLQVVSGSRLVLSATFSGADLSGSVAGVERREELVGERLSEEATGTLQTRLSTSWQVDRSDLLVWSVSNSQGREPSSLPSLRLTLVPNRRPQVRWISPRQDLSAHPLQEFELRASAEDDFGVIRHGFTIRAGSEPEVELASEPQADAPLSLEWSDLLRLEERSLRPGRLVSLSAWAEDFDDQGELRRTTSDLLFIDIRPFEWRFREADPESAQAAQQSQQSPNGQAGESPNADLAERQKQALIAAWNLMRRAADAPEWQADARVVLEAQIEISASVREALAGDNASDEEELSAAERLEIERASIDAVDGLMNAADQQTLSPLNLATAAQQRLLEYLIANAEEEMSVARSQSNSPSSGQRAAGPSQQQLQSLELSANRNRYEQETSAQQRQSEQARQEREQLSRLEELAQRQRDVNREIQEALEQRDAQTQSEAQERLERLRERQQELRADAENLQADLERRADNATEREQLSNARDAAQRAEAALEQQDLGEALAQGRRSAVELQDLQRQLQRRTGSELRDSIEALNQQLEEMQARQEEIREQLGDSQNGQTSGTSLRGERRTQERLMEQLQDRQAQWQQSLERLRELTEESAATAPRVSERLYDAYRDAVQQPLEALNNQARQLIEQGNIDGAVENEARVDERIDDLKESLAEAAQLAGNDASQSLALAESMLEELAEEIEGRTGNAPNEESSPANQAGGERSENGEPQQGPSESAGDAQAPTSQDADATQENGARNNSAGNSSQESDSSGQQPGTENANSSANPSENATNQSQNSPQSNSSQQNSPQPNSAQPGASQPGNSSLPSEASPSSAPGSNGSGGGNRANQGPASLRSGRGDERPAGNSPQDSAANGPRQDGPRQDGPQGTGEPTGAATIGGAQRGPTLSGESALVGEDFREWLNRLEDVESLVLDERLREEAARIRQQATEMRRDFLRHSLPPQTAEIEAALAEPLRRLSAEVAAERRRLAGDDVSVRLDQDPVPAGWENHVRRYFESLGVGRE